MESVTVFAISAPAGAVEVYLIRVGDDDGLDQADRLYNVRWTAARLGCDGVLIRESVPDQLAFINAQRAYAPGTRVSGTVMTQGHVTAVCIAFPDRSCPRCEPSTPGAGR
jgi:hypothetical protein